VVSVDPLQSIGFGNILLKVEEKDVKEVKIILKELKKEKFLID
jgi:hydrogenase maturation factor